MIGSVTGTILECSEDSVLIQLGGFGLQVQCTPSTCRDLRVGDCATLATALVVREDSLTLFGFADSDQRAVFSVLQSVSGVGPRLALAVLATLTPDQLRCAVHAGDTATLMQISGIGRKGAQRMILDLADRLMPPTAGRAVDVRDNSAAPHGQAPPWQAPPWQAPVQRALVGLGWSERDADSAVAAVRAEIAREDVASADPGKVNPGPDARTDDIAAMLKRALRSLDNR